MIDGVSFTKMSGAGNDFIVIDNRDGKIPEEGRRELFEPWCTRRLGIGADGVLLVEPAEGNADFRMRYYNADGGEAESCGNGARCISNFAFLIGAAPRTMKFETRAGLYHATVVEDGVILTLSDPHSLRRDVEISLPELPGIKADYINTGVPHAVVFVSDLESIDVQSLGAKLRYHPAFAPAGANANFVQQFPDGRFAMRTYERGVEGETLACGTGAAAVGLIASLKGLASSPIAIQTSGGPVLRIHFDRNSQGFTHLRLEGEARIVYEGSVGASRAAGVV